MAMSQWNARKIVQKKKKTYIFSISSLYESGQKLLFPTIVYTFSGKRVVEESAACLVPISLSPRSVFFFLAYLASGQMGICESKQSTKRGLTFLLLGQSIIRFLL